MTTANTPLVLEGSSFFVSEPSGDVVPGHDANGYFFADMRHLSTWRLFMDGEPVRLLSSRALVYYSASIHGTLARALVHKTRPSPSAGDRFLSDGVHEDLVVENHTEQPVALNVRLRFTADFADLFQVKERRPKVGQTSAEVVRTGSPCSTSGAAIARNRHRLQRADQAGGGPCHVRGRAGAPTAVALLIFPPPGMPDGSSGKPGKSSPGVPTRHALPVEYPTASRPQAGRQARRCWRSGRCSVSTRSMMGCARRPPCRPRSGSCGCAACSSAERGGTRPDRRAPLSARSTDAGRRVPECFASPGRLGLATKPVGGQHRDPPAFRAHDALPTPAAERA